MSEPLEIVSTKVSRQDKRRIDDGAMNYNMNRSEFIRDILFQKITKLEQFSELPSSVIVDREDAAEVAKLIEELQNKYPQSNGSDLIKAALRFALDSESRWLDSKLKKFI